MFLSLRIFINFISFLIKKVKIMQMLHITIISCPLYKNRVVSWYICIVQSLDARMCERGKSGHSFLFGDQKR